MPLLMGYANYGDRDTDSTRWARMLRNRPISLGIDYFVSNMMDRETSKIDVESGGFLNHKAKSKIGENEKEILRGEFLDPIGYGWMFKILRGKYRETEGARNNWAKWQE